MTELKAEVTISRMIDAPVDLVFRAWTEGEHLAKWYAPEGFGVAKAEADAKQGGVFTIVMQGPDGAEYPLWGTYTEFNRPTKPTCRPPRPEPTGRRRSTRSRPSPSSITTGRPS
jgi:hypothetical protein